MAAPRSAAQLEQIASFVKRLYEIGEFATWKDMADQSGVHPVSVSKYQRAVEEASGWNLLSLIQATAARTGSDAESLALRVARESFQNQLAYAVGLLEKLGVSVSDVLVNQDDGIRKIDELAERLPQPDASHAEPSPAQASPKP